MMTVRYLLALPLLAASIPAYASSDAAWSALEARVTARCIAASGLRAVHASRPIGFDDTLGKVVTLVEGSQRLATGRSVRVAKLCVFDQRSGRVWLSEADGWHAPRRPALSTVPR